MKKIILIHMLFIFFSVAMYPEARFHLSLSGNYWIPVDDDYQTIFGKSMIYPELKLGVKIYKRLYLWLGYGYLAADGTIPILDEPASSSQHHVSLGAGCEIPIVRWLIFRIEAGSHNAFFREKSQSSEETGTAFGYRGDAGLFFSIGKNFFLGLTAGYLSAAKTVNANSVNFGGLMTGLALGFRL